jgi:hypothetical protein
VASGKADASMALDETMSSLASKADELKQLAAAGDMDNTVNDLFGMFLWLLVLVCLLQASFTTAATCGMLMQHIQ